MDWYLGAMPATGGEGLVPSELIGCVPYSPALPFTLPSSVDTSRCCGHQTLRLSSVRMGGVDLEGPGLSGGPAQRWARALHGWGERSEQQESWLPPCSRCCVTKQQGNAREEFVGTPKVAG